MVSTRFVRDLSASSPLSPPNNDSIAKNRSDHSDHLALVFLLLSPLPEYNTAETQVVVPNLGSISTEDRSLISVDLSLLGSLYVEDAKAGVSNCPNFRHI